MKPYSDCTKLEKAARSWLKDYGDNYEDGAQGAYDDLMYGGCQSGIVGELIYYSDTIKFYKRHRQEIDAMLAEMCQDCDCSPQELLRDWDKDDPLARDISNQNLLAWFGFEEAARRVMED